MNVKSQCTKCEKLSEKVWEIGFTLRKVWQPAARYISMGKNNYLCWGCLAELGVKISDTHGYPDTSRVTLENLIREIVREEIEE